MNNIDHPNGAITTARNYQVFVYFGELDTRIPSEERKAVTNYSRTF